MDTTTQTKIKIGDRLKELRLSSPAFSREHVARLLDTCEKTVWCHEVGRTGIAKIWLMGYAEVYGTTVEALLEGTDWVKPGK